MRDPGAVAGVVLGPAVEGREFTWQGTDSGGASRDVIVLRRSPDPDDRVRALEALEALRVPCLGHRQTVVDITACRVGVAIIAPPLRGRRLDTAVGVRGRPGALSVSDAVRIGVPIARELAALHARGVAFGADDLAAEIMIDASGKSVLAIDRFAQRLVSGAPGSAQDDRRSLVNLLRRLVRPDRSRVADRFQQALSAADCAALALALSRVGPGVPVRSWAEAWGRRRARGGHRLARAARNGSGGGRLRAVRGPVALVVAVVVVAVAGWFSVRGHPAQAGSGLAVNQAGVTATPDGAAGSAGPSEATDWRAVLTELDARRSAFFAGGAVLEDVDVAGSAAYDDDVARWKSLQDKGLRAVGLTFTVTDVQVVSERADRVDLVVTDTLPSYRLVDSGGTPVQSVAGRGSTTWAITLRTAGRGRVPWRFASVSPG